MIVNEYSRKANICSHPCQVPNRRASIGTLVPPSAVARTVRSVVALDRAQERRRAVALAHHYRDEEGLSIAEIARRLGRADATVKAYL